jgi:hypothetical protein
LEFTPPERYYIRETEAALVKAAETARDRLKNTSIKAGVGHTSIPMSRRCNRNGQFLNAPAPDGETYNSLPVCLFETDDGEPICLLFAASTHVVCMRGEAVSADYPGVAVDMLDQQLDKECSMFLQGTGGDSRPALLGQNHEAWKRNCGWTEATQVGRTLAEEVISLIPDLRLVKPSLRCALIETEWPLEPHLSKEEYLAIPDGRKSDSDRSSPKHLWGHRMARLIDRKSIPSAAQIFFQGIQLGEGIRITALEGEAMAAQGRMMEDFFKEKTADVTFAIGYTNGEGLYLATTQMLEEGGYEAVSFWEYGFPSALAKGTEQVLQQGLAKLKALGIG